VPPRRGEIVDEKHRGERIGDLLKRGQLGELLRVTDASTRAIGEHLKEGEAKIVGDSLRDLLSEAVRPARMTARDARDSRGGPATMQLLDKLSHKFGRLADEPRVELPLRPL
jgi:hypothetical protein